jgi:hypothetical protein
MVLAKSKKGKYVLVVEDKTYKVLLSRKCKKKGFSVSGTFPTFNPKDHKRNLEVIGHDEITQGVVIPYGTRNRELFVYCLDGKLQWRPSTLFSDKESDVQEFKRLFETSQAVIDGSDTKAAVSKTDRSGPGRNGSEFKTLLNKLAEITQRVIDLADKQPAAVQKDFKEMFKSHPEATLGVIYPDMGPLQKLLCCATKPEAVGEKLFKVSSSILLPYLMSVNPEERAKAVGACSTDDTKNMQLLLPLIECLVNVLKELIRTNRVENCVIKFCPP